MQKNLIADGKYTDTMDEVLLKIIEIQSCKQEGVIMKKVIYNEKNAN